VGEEGFGWPWIGLLAVGARGSGFGHSSLDLAKRLDRRARRVGSTLLGRGLERPAEACVAGRKEMSAETHRCQEARAARSFSRTVKCPGRDARVASFLRRSAGGGRLLGTSWPPKDKDINYDASDRATGAGDSTRGRVQSPAISRSETMSRYLGNVVVHTSAATVPRSPCTGKGPSLPWGTDGRLFWAWTRPSWGELMGIASSPRRSPPMAIV
jgi:hypothetical protein